MYFQSTNQKYVIFKICQQSVLLFTQFKQQGKIKLGLMQEEVHTTFIYQRSKGVQT
jgi:hypothetical protein